LIQGFHHAFFFVLTLVIAAALTLVPLPSPLGYWRPEWVSLLLFFWTLRYPQHFGLITSWLVGLAWDVLLHSPLGLHALTLSLQAYLVLLMLHRLQMYPLAQQSFVLFLLVGIQLMAYRWLNGLFAHPATDLNFLWAAFTTAALWPLASLILHRVAHDA